MKKFFALYSLLSFSLFFFSFSLIPASAPEPDHEQSSEQDGEIVCSIPLDQLQIIYLRPAHKTKKPKPSHPENKEEDEKHAFEQGISAAMLFSRGGHLDTIHVMCPYCTTVQHVYPETVTACEVCGSFFETPPTAHKNTGIPKPDNGIDFGADYMPDYAPLSPQELATLKIQSTKPVRQNLGAQDCAVHALANALTINTALLAKSQPGLDMRESINTESHKLYYAQIEKACMHDTYNLSSEIIEHALYTLQKESIDSAHQQLFTNIFVLDNVAELPLLEDIRKAVIALPTQPDHDPGSAIHFICNTRPYYGDPAQLNGRQAGKHWVTLSLIKEKNRISFYFSDSNYGRIPETLHPLIRILAERYHIIAPNQNPQYQAPQEQNSVVISLFKWLVGW